MTTDEVKFDTSDGEDCDHDWEFVDDSFSHEYGTEIAHYWKCSKCEETKDATHTDHCEDF